MDSPDCPDEIKLAKAPDLKTARKSYVRSPALTTAAVRYDSSDTASSSSPAMLRAMRLFKKGSVWPLKASQATAAMARTKVRTSIGVAVTLSSPSMVKPSGVGRANWVSVSAVRPTWRPTKVKTGARNVVVQRVPIRLKYNVKIPEMSKWNTVMSVYSPTSEAAAYSGTNLASLNWIVCTTCESSDRWLPIQTVRVAQRRK
mmetsp:Transcript_120094/g.209067  ORF Transcript_120094/g.209067 Transcript_120094/m.209067 type:complete len:201 (+) Transcript_120094:1491-2093(+)